jgi:Skp family chaperone for outer membrane proteins
MLGRYATAVAFCLCVWAVAPAAGAQEAVADTPVSAIVTVDQERMFSESLWGKRATAELEEASHQLQTENRKIEAALTAEEKSLTEQRKTLPAEEFRKLADDFDARVTGIRLAQETKTKELTSKRDTDRQEFFDVALPILGEVMTAHKAVAILDSRAIFLSVKSIDVTAEVVARLDAKLGDGAVKSTP